MKSKEFYYNKFCELAKNKSGKVISQLEEYKNAYSKLIVKCSNNHNFPITLSNLNLNRWCSQCKCYKMERYTKACLESITDKKFIKIRPDWLKNQAGNCLELDMYNEDLNLAIEYNGEQHYKFCEFFHKTENDFLKRVEDDNNKIKICKEKNINLIIVSYKTKNIEEFLENELKILNIDIVPKISRNKIQVSNEYKEQITKIVHEKKGKLLTENFILKIDSIKLECEKNHIFDSKVKYILNGSWCDECRDKTQDENTKNKISENLIKYFESDKGKKIKLLSHKKRSDTMQKQRELIRESITNKNCKGSCKRENLPIDKFNKKSDTKDGYQPYCKDCIINIKKKKN